MPSAAPSVNAIATEACFVDANILNSILNLCGSRVAALGQLAAAAAPGVAPGSARTYKICCGIGESKSGYQLFVNQLFVKVLGSREPVSHLDTMVECTAFSSSRALVRLRW